MFNTPHRNHPTFILERIGSLLLVVILFFGNALTAGTQSLTQLLEITYWKTILRQLMNGNFSVLLSTAGIFILLLVIIGVSVLRWSRTFFHIEEDMLFSERRTIIRKLSKLPINSITTVNVEQNLFEKLCKTAKVKIDINSAVTANKTDFIFILKYEQAQQLKSELLAMREEKQEQEQSSPKTLLAAFTAGDALRHKLLSIPFVEILMAAFVVLPMFFGESAMHLSEALPVLGLSAVLYIGSLVIGTLNLVNFRLETDGQRIYISHGVLHTHSYAFEKGRVKAVFLRQSLLARLFGLCSVELAVVGLGNEKNESPRLCLLVSKQRAEQLIQTLLPDYCVQKDPLVSSKAALIPAFCITAVCTALAAVLIAYFPLYGYILTAVVLVFGIFSGCLSQKTRTVSLEETLFCCSSGILNKKTGRFRYCDLQEARYTTNAVMKNGNIGRIGFSILSAKTVSVQKTGWFAKEIFEALSEKILSAPDACDL